MKCYLDIIKNNFRFLGPPYKQKEERWKFHMLSVGYQNRVKRVFEFISEDFFGKYSKWKFGFAIVEKGHFSRPFSSSKLKICSKQFNGSIFAFLRGLRKDTAN